jgi:acetoin utilization protein AcuC
MLVHTREYLDRVKRLEKRRGFLSPDTQVLPGSFDAARLIVGATVGAVQAAARDGLALGFGGLHHAGPDYGEGFCILNDIAVAVKVLLEDGYERIAILDTDAHQGNGTMDIFWHDPRVLFISLHQDPLTLYPGRGFTGEIGEGSGEGYTVNIPMPPYAGIEAYEMAMDEIVFPIIEEFEPQVLIRNGGSDPLATDILTNLGMDLESLSALNRSIARKADEMHTPLADLFLSGYGPYVTEGWLALIRGTLDEEMSLHIPETDAEIPARRRNIIIDSMRETLDELIDLLKPYWSTFT